MTKYAVAVDLTKCMRCYSCFVSCKQENNCDDGIQFTRVYTLGPTIYKQYYHKPTMHFFSFLCQHCAEPRCAAVCPVHAITKKNGVVILDESLCIGCQKCIAACPYGVPQFNEDKFVAQKCNLCNHRIEAGLKPSCVKHCLTGARVFGDLDDPNSDVSKLAAKGAEAYHPEYQTKPNVKYVGLPKPLLACQTVDGPRDEVLEGVSVTLTDLANGENWTLVSDEWGDVQFKDINRYRMYSIKAEKEGYRTKLIGAMHFTEDIFTLLKLSAK